MLLSRVTPLNSQHISADSWTSSWWEKQMHFSFNLFWKLQHYQSVTSELKSPQSSPQHTITATMNDRTLHHNLCPVYHLTGFNHMHISHQTKQCLRYCWVHLCLMLKPRSSADPFSSHIEVLVFIMFLFQVFCFLVFCSWCFILVHVVYLLITWLPAFDCDLVPAQTLSWHRGSELIL